MFLKDFTRTATPESILAVIPAMPSQGLSASTLVETDCGWHRADSLHIGARVHTLDGGLATILAVSRQPVRDMPAILIPGGIVGNCADLILPRGQQILVDTLGDAALPDADLVLVPAAAFRGLPGVCDTTLTDELILPMFADEEALWANSGTLLHCPAIAGNGLDGSFFTELPLSQARAFLARRWARLM